MWLQTVVYLGLLVVSHYLKKVYLAVLVLGKNLDGLNLTISG